MLLFSLKWQMELPFKSYSNQWIPEIQKAEDDRIQLPVLLADVFRVSSIDSEAEAAIASPSQPDRRWDYPDSGGFGNLQKSGNGGGRQHFGHRRNRFRQRRFNSNGSGSYSCNSCTAIIFSRLLLIINTIRLTFTFFYYKKQKIPKIELFQDLHLDSFFIHTKQCKYVHVDNPIWW